MLSWVTPFWLLGLALLPVIRWLHRGGRQRRVVPVPHLGLWQGSNASQPHAGQRQPPDPAWRRRALLTALLFIALAEPQLPQRHPAVTLWVDDSLSMLTREHPVSAGLTSTREPVGSDEQRDTRLVAGLAQARTQLDQIAHGEVAVRTLSDPWRYLGTFSDAVVATLVAGAGQKEPVAPPAALLRPDSLHWLVTDGADAALFEWPDGRRPDRIIQVAEVSRNVGLERLSARRNPDDPEKIDLLLKVTNGGTATETRAAVIATDAGDMARSTHRLEPGASAFVSATIPASAGVRATLQPGDALAEDDEIALDLAPLRRRRVAIDSNCPTALVAAVGAHPALALAPETATGVEAVLNCGTRRAGNSVATIRVLADRTPTQPAGPVKWSSTVAESRRIRLDAGRLQVGAQLQARPVDTVILAMGDEPVIVSRAGAPKLIESSLDFGLPGIMPRPELPLLVNLMFEQLFGSGLLDEITIANRGPVAVMVAPKTVMGPIAVAQRTSESPALSDWTRPLLVAALLVLLWEIVALFRQSYRLREFAGVRSK